MSEGDDRADDRLVGGAGGKVANETAIDLQLVDRKAAQVAEARIADTEVVDGNRHAHFTQLPEDASGFLGIGHHGAFREFNLQQCRVETRGLQS